MVIAEAASLRCFTEKTLTKFLKKYPETFTAEYNFTKNSPCYTCFPRLSFHNRKSMSPDKNSSKTRTAVCIKYCPLTTSQSKILTRQVTFSACADKSASILLVVKENYSKR